LLKAFLNGFKPLSRAEEDRMVHHIQNIETDGGKGFNPGEVSGGPAEALIRLPCDKEDLAFHAKALQESRDLTAFSLRQIQVVNNLDLSLPKLQIES
jgi:hypothetical protein